MTTRTFPDKVIDGVTYKAASAPVFMDGSESYESCVGCAAHESSTRTEEYLNDLCMALGTTCMEKPIIWVRKP